MDPHEHNAPAKKPGKISLIIASVVGQVGCFTLIIIIGSVLLGIWLDKTYQTAPRWTIILVLVSIPVSLFATYLVARVAMNKVQKQSLSADKEKPTQEAGTIGHDD